ncbi:hypothetical protein TcasGA2_TC033485 [Tribolium castaneum]|uniref:Uncharacterized protein n=1 Tax=Tribolium castaneum TaxID=7070 RepID=A0A139W8C9_TRICA|nr:hypothetical protein TcasGA2_TC033485 [Tribolium castaneum]
MTIGGGGLSGGFSLRGVLGVTGGLSSAPGVPVSISSTCNGSNLFLILIFDLPGLGGGVLAIFFAGGDWNWSLESTISGSDVVGLGVAGIGGVNSAGGGILMSGTLFGFRIFVRSPMASKVRFVGTILCGSFGLDLTLKMVWFVLRKTIFHARWSAQLAQVQVAKGCR